MAAQRALLAAQPEHVGIRRIEAFNRRAFIAGRERRQQVLGQVDEVDVSVKRRHSF